MPIISRIGRRNWAVRLLLESIFVLLAIGAVSMIYPFLLMIAGSTKSAVDAAETRIIPSFLVDDDALYRKYAEGLFNESLHLMQATYDSDAATFAALQRPPPAPPALLDAWEYFLRDADLPATTYTLGFLRAAATRGVQPQYLRRWKDELYREHHGDIHAVNRALGTTYANWNSIDMRPGDFLARRSPVQEGELAARFNEFKARQPLADRYYFSVEGYYRNAFLRNRYGRDLAALNAAHGTHYAAWREVRLDERYPAGNAYPAAVREDWETFVRYLINLQWLEADGTALAPYRDYLLAKYNGAEGLARTYGPAYANVDDVRLPVPGIAGGLVYSDWEAFVQGWRDPLTERWHRLPLESARIRSLESMFRDDLRARHGDLASANAALGTDFADWSAIGLPQQAWHAHHFGASMRALRWEFVARNFITVWDFIVVRGRGVFNTAVYCLLSVVVALVFNPLAAYALSRYRPPSAYKVLLFLMLTMAFPPMVTQIPVFLLLRDFNMLNTFWALILPGVANGYSIFLLKGFFDSLPKELYESASIDGAGEFRIFWQITMSLSTPILAVIALNAFTAAYSNFMFALLICQDQRMWTLMPWLYQLQQGSGPGVVYASLLIAAIPTFIIFALCQNIIMRGIVVPVEK